jgi:hypothetical protein
MVSMVDKPTDTPVPKKPKKTRVGRRAFLATAATVTVCGAGALAVPRMVPILESKAQDMARVALLDELGSLEGVSLDAAIQAAEVTRAAVKILVLPLARFVSLVGTGALALLLKGLDVARTAMSTLHLDASVLDAFHGVVASWQGGISSLPIALDAYGTADIESGERYLRALKHLAEHPHAGSVG